MTTHGPPVEALMRRLAETPGDFLAEPRVSTGGAVHVDAVVHDVIADHGTLPGKAELAVFAAAEPAARNWLRMVLIGAWLVHDESLRGADTAAIVSWLTNGLRDLARLVDAEQCVVDQDRREELSRLLLAHLGLTPEGETPEQAADRLTTVDSVQRARVLAETKAKRDRAEELRREMEKQRAREAAGRYTRE